MLFYRARALDVKTTYTAADAAYLGRRRLRRHARVLHLWAMGVGAVISGDFFGWNFGLAAGGFGGMIAGRADHDGDVHRPLLLDCRDVARAAARGRRVLFRAHFDGAGGGLHHGTGGKYGVHSDARGDRGRHRRLSGGGVRHAAGMGAALVAAGVRGFRGAQCVGRGDDVPRVRGGHADRARGADCVLGGRGAALRPSSMGGALFPARPLQGVFRHRATSVRAVALSRDRATAARRRREPRPEARYAARHSAGTGHADCGLVPHGGTQRRHGSGRRRDVLFQRAAVSRLPDDFRTGAEDARAGADCLHRPDRQLSHHHFCLRAADLFALAGGIFSHLALGDARHARDSAARPAFRAVRWDSWSPWPYTSRRRGVRSARCC